VAWKAVSKHATPGTPGSTRWTAATAARDFGWCSGARSVSARSLASMPSSIRTGAVNAVPP
jgi:hypothetical protein